MQLGVRWRAGDAPHRGVPPELHDAIRAQEHAHPGAHSWTLTWLEGRPRCALDDLVVITVYASGETRVEGAADAASDTSGTDTERQAEDDDDWLQ